MIWQMQITRDLFDNIFIFKTKYQNTAMNLRIFFFFFFNSKLKKLHFTLELEKKKKK